jgi:broad specificity phosphatase PhoE
VVPELILGRHGVSEDNVARKAQGWGDSELSARGREQVQRLAQRLAAMQPTALYSSPLGRAMSTARAISEATGLEIIPLEDVREMNYGRWEGRSFMDVRREDEDIYQRWIVDENCACPEGESHRDVRTRVLRGLAGVNSERAIVVSHGTAIRIIATALLELPVMAAIHFAQDNAAMNLFVQRADGRWVLKHWNVETP